MTLNHSFTHFRSLIFADLYRIGCKTSTGALLRQVLFGEAFQYIFWMRACRYLRDHAWLKYSIYPLALLLLNHYRYKYGINISFIADIGPGFYIGHFSGIMVYPLTKIGKNCNLSQGVTIGKTNRGKHQGYPMIGDNVYIGPGAKIIGAVRVGDFAAIGANCVVTKDVPDHAVVVGIPGRVISYEGSQGYVENTVPIG